MKNKNISQEILETIKEKKITPKPKWQFLFKNYFIWAITGIFLIIGGLSAAVIIYMIDNNDWDLYQQASDSLLGFIFATLPYFWILFLILFVFIADYNFRQTKGGYRYGLTKIILSTVLFSLILGFLFYNIGLARTIDRVFNDIPIYERIMEHRHQIWMQPNRGLLVGQVLSARDENNFILKDLNGEDWQVFCCRDMVIEEKLEKGLKIRAIGQEKENNNFEALKIMPLIGRKWMMKEIMPSSRINR